MSRYLLIGLSANLLVMIPNFIRKKFLGVQVPLGKWIVCHVLEFIILSPAIFTTWLYLKIRKYEVIIVGVASSAISSFLAPLEPELRKRLKTKVKLKNTIVLNLSVDANSHIRKMYNRVVNIYGAESQLRRRVIWWATKIGVNASVPDQVLSESSWRRNCPSVEMSLDDDEIGRAYLDSIGIGRSSDFICYATRTESYYAKLIHNGVIVKPRSVRNPVEMTYIEVAHKLSNNGPSVIRMGKDLDSSITSIDFPTIVDYATASQSDLLDCFLLKNAKYLINGATGIFWFRALFNKPSVLSDIYDIRFTGFINDLCIFQKVSLINEKRLATVSEMLKMKSEYSDERHQARLGVELVKNTADEIYTICQEMNARIDGTWKSKPEDEELQQRFLDLVIKYSDQPAWHGGGRVGTQFLRDNQDLLK